MAASWRDAAAKLHGSAAPAAVFWSLDFAIEPVIPDSFDGSIDYKTPSISRISGPGDQVAFDSKNIFRRGSD